MKFDQNKISIALISIGTVLIIAAITLFALVAAGVVGGGSGGNSSLATIAGFGEVITKPTPGPSSTPAAQYPPGDNAPVERLIIDKAQIDAPVVVKGVDDAGVMQSPDNAYDTAWYDFSAHPGSGSNAVFSGHVDYVHVGKAVFWYIKDLEQGDLVQVRLTDGTVYKYAVTSKNVYDAATAPVDQIVGPTPTETVTLITCGGTFDPATHQYDKRTVVRAERILDSAPGALPAAPSGVVQR
jgi:LPXTG-site transpeptidase (sortase) family protein